MARTPIDTGVKIQTATVSPGADAAHYHYELTALKRDGWTETPFVADVEVLLGDTLEDQENAIIHAINTAVEV